MDETDMEAYTRRIDAPAPPQVPDQRQDEADHFETPSHFDTPSWLGPDRTHQYETPAPPVVPTQAYPDHDRIHAAAPAVSERAYISEGRWVESAPPRKLAGLLQLAAFAGLVGSLIAAVATKSPVAIGAAVACGFIVVVFRVVLMSSGVATTELKNGRLVVTKDGIKDIFNLTDPVHLVETVGNPADSSWRLRLETVDGRIVELGPTHVKAAELHPVVEHYRAVADNERRDRERRFNR